MCKLNKEKIRKIIKEELSKKNDEDMCPSCGRCKHCGRGGQEYYPFYPTYPSPSIPDPTYPYREWEITCDSTIGDGSSGGILYTT